MARLNIYDRRERALVAAADALLVPVALWRRFAAPASGPPSRILCFRLERIGDLLMTLPALAELRARAPGASIDLVVGSWNREIASAIPGIDRVETIDADWLARPNHGLTPIGLALQAARWRGRRYDLAINFEPDIRTNVAIAAAGARRTVGFASGGGGPVLDLALDYGPASHTADNAIALVRAALGDAGSSAGAGATPRIPDAGAGATPRIPDPGAAATPRIPDPGAAVTLRIPDAARADASRLLAPFAGRLKVGLHVSGGRAIKQWPEARFRDVAEHLVRDRNAAIVLTGTAAERAQVEIVRSALPPDRVLDLSGGTSLLTVAAVIAQLDLFVTGDTGPMHLAHAVGTPIVAVFGPSDPARYAPRGARDTVVRIDLPCSPCNRIRRPPARCVGHTPDCLAGIDTARVLAAIDEALRGAAR